MKMLYCIPGLYNSGGMERILTEKVNWLCEHGYSIDIVTTEQLHRQPFFALNGSINLINFDLDFNSHFGSNLIKKYFSHYRKLKKYKRLLKNIIIQGDYDIVISLGGKELEFLGKLDIRSKKIAEIHFPQKYKEQFLLSKHKGILNRVLGKILNFKFIKSTKNLDKLVVLTKDDENQWLKTNNNVTQIYNFVNNVPIIEKPKCNNRCIAVGRLDEQKGFDLLIPAWELVNKQFPDWSLDIYGTGKWESKLQEDIKSRHLENKVYLRGQSNNISKELRESEIFILSSRYEGFPMVLLEAESQGLPIVAFDCKTGPNEIIEDGGNGFLVPNGNIVKLAEGIIKLMGNNEMRYKFGRKSTELVKRFDKEEIMARWCEIFEEK